MLPNKACQLQKLYNTFLFHFTTLSKFTLPLLLITFLINSASQNNLSNTSGTYFVNFSYIWMETTNFTSVMTELMHVVRKDMLNYCIYLISLVLQ